jgi:hypothetical protein
MRIHAGTKQSTYGYGGTKQTDGGFYADHILRFPGG